MSVAGTRAGNGGIPDVENVGSGWEWMGMDGNGSADRHWQFCNIATCTGQMMVWLGDSFGLSFHRISGLRDAWPRACCPQLCSGRHRVGRSDSTRSNDYLWLWNNDLNWFDDKMIWWFSQFLSSLPWWSWWSMILVPSFLYFLHHQVWLCLPAKCHPKKREERCDVAVVDFPA